MADNKKKLPNASTYAAQFAACRELRRYRQDFHCYQANGCYRPMEEEGLAAEIRRAVVAEFGVGAALPRYVQSIVECLKHETFISGERNAPFWTNGAGPRDVFATPTGLLDFSPIWSGGAVRLLPHNPAFFTLGYSPVIYNPAAVCPQWLAFLRWQHDGNEEVIDLIHEYMAYCILQSLNLQQFLFFSGNGDNGKSVLAALAEAVLGSTNCSHVPLEMIGSQFQTAQSIGKLCNIIADAEQTDKLIESRLKQHVAGDVMHHDRKFKSALEVPATTRIWAFGNSVARFRDKSNAMPRRLRIVPCNVTIKGKPDRQLIQKLTVEAPGILNEVIRGAARLGERGEFAVPQVCRDAECEFWMQNHPIKLFLEQYTRLNLAEFVPTQQLYNAYKERMDKWGWKYTDWIEEFGREVRRFYAGAISDGAVRHRRASKQWVEQHSFTYGVDERPRGFEGIELLHLDLPTENDIPEQEVIPF